MNKLANSLPVPVLCDSLVESSKRIPDSYLLATPYEIVKVLSELIKNNFGETNPYIVVSEETKWVNYKDTILYEYALTCLENYNYLFDIANNMLFEYKARFGYEHRCVSAIDWIEYIIPSIIPFEAPAIPLMCKKSPREYIVDYSEDKTISYTSWMVWLRDVQKHTLVFTNRETPYYATKNKMTNEMKEQQKSIMVFWEDFISKRIYV